MHLVAGFVEQDADIHCLWCLSGAIFAVRSSSILKLNFIQCSKVVNDVCSRCNSIVYWYFDCSNGKRVTPSAIARLVGY